MDPLRVTSRLTIPASDLEVGFARSGGPGGQNVNKVETKVQLRFNLGRCTALSDAQRARLETRLASRLTTGNEIIVQASRFRNRASNLEDARERLAKLLRAALAEPKARKATKPGRGARERRLKAKRERSEAKRRRRQVDD